MKHAPVIYEDGNVQEIKNHGAYNFYILFLFHSRVSRIQHRITKEQHVTSK